MKTYFKYIVVLFFALFTACKKDSMPMASDPAQDAYARVDNASSDIDHQIYLIYQQTKIPILYSDTISKSPLNILNLNYQIAGSNGSYVYSYPKSKTDILAGIAFIRDRIIPALGPNVKVYSISLLDTLKTVQVYSPYYSVTTNYSVVPALTTFGIANVPQIATMNADQLKAYKAGIFTNLLVNPLNTSGLLKDFNAVSAAFYNKYAYLGYDPPGSLPLIDKRGYGFLLDGTESPYYYLTPDETGDLKLFLSKVLTMSAADFQAQNGDYTLVMSKYNLLKEALLTLGFDLTKV